MKPSTAWLNQSVKALRNQLGKSNNPYLQSHKLNPVAWQEWGRDALDLAVKENKPIFLSIGYHTCHWCHVMNDESFSNEKIAKILNKDFVPIKVDREERPDIDAVYMMYLQASTGHGGWPLNVFLVPGSLDPIYGGTYFAGPDTSSSHGKRSLKFEDILKRVSTVWTEENEACRTSAKSIADKLGDLVRSQSNANGPESLPIDQMLKDTNEYFLNHFDSYYGGYSSAPKFPCPHNISFLLKYAERLPKSEEITNSALFTLQKIGQGGIKDQIGHGFSRYSVSEDWNVPHFEKMIYDQALLLHAYLDAIVYGKGSEVGVEYARDIIEFLKSGSLVDGLSGAFFSGQDADSLNPITGENSEGAYYVWRYDEFFQALSEPLGRMNADICAMYWNVQEQGNVDSQYDIQGELANYNVLSQGDIDVVAQAFGKKPQQVLELVQKSKPILREYRDKNRAVPVVDSKLLSGWNGLAIGALARGGLILGDVSATQAAERATQHILSECWNGSRLLRVVGSTTPGMVDDYGYMIWGLLELYEATGKTEYLEHAVGLQSCQLDLFWDEAHGGFFTSSKDDSTKLMFRPKSAFDAAEPSANGVSVRNLVRLYSITGTKDYAERAQKTLRCYGEDISAQPFGYCGLVGQAMAIDSIASYIVVGGTPDQGRQRVAELAKTTTDADKTIVHVNEASIKYLSLFDHVYEELFTKHKDDATPTVMKCKDMSCQLVN